MRESSEHFELLRQMTGVRAELKDLQRVSRANGRKLDLLLSKTVNDDEIAALVRDLAADDQSLKEAVDADQASLTNERAIP